MKFLFDLLPVILFFAAYKIGGANPDAAHALAAGWLGDGIAVSQAPILIATFVAMTANFLLNNRITYRDRRLRGAALPRGLLLFYVVCGIGAAANVGIAGLLLRDGLLNWGLAGAAGAMLFVVSHEIIPESHRRGHETLATGGLIVGFVLMMLMDAVLG